MTDAERFAELVYRTARLFDLVRGRADWDELTLGERTDWIETMGRVLEQLPAAAEERAA